MHWASRSLFCVSIFGIKIQMNGARGGKQDKQKGEVSMSFQWIQISLIMNKNQKAKVLPPSPRATAARKPLINITSMYTNSAEYPSSSPALYLPKTSKNSNHHRISIDDCNRPKIKEVHSRKNSRSGSVTSISSSAPKDKEPRCKKHPNRTAMYRLEGSEQENLCHECSLFLAKNGMKIKPILMMNDRVKAERESEINDYIDKCQHTYSDLMKWRQEQVKAVREIYQQFGSMINNEQVKMEEQIARIRAIYTSHIEMLQNKREEKAEIFKRADGDAQELVKNLSEAKEDIQRNYSECLTEFAAKSFRQNMDEYWRVLQSAQFFVVSNSILKLSKETGIEMTLTVRSIENTKDNPDKQFTFSKEARFETPPFEKSFRGVKQVNSYGHSGEGLPSELRESIVDSRFSFHDVNPFVA